ncbi:hypothetical protein JCM8097_008547 [Rhodosporidiobolus ruineniae]
MANDDPPEVPLEELHECAVCSATTTSRCSACKEVFFCSKDHQRLLWFTHKYLCGRDPVVFFCPPLFSHEALALSKIQSEPYMLLGGAAARPDALLRFFQKKRLYDGNWAELFRALSGLSSTIPEPRRSLLLLHARNHLMVSSLAAALGHSAWRLLSTAACFILTISAQMPGVPDGDEFLRVFNPYLRAKLVLTSLVQSHDEGHERMPGYEHGMLDLAQSRLAEAVNALPVSASVKFALQASDAAGFAAVQSRRGFRDAARASP